MKLITEEAIIKTVQKQYLDIYFPYLDTEVWKQTLRVQRIAIVKEVNFYLPIFVDYTIGDITKRIDIVIDKDILLHLWRYEINIPKNK